ncbi:hypothetical protein [Paenibacillus plantarum]|nr:hypothetical protein [Paenibacillus plantarum]
MRDPLFEVKNRYVILEGKKVIGEVFVINERYIATLKKVRRGISCRKAG